MLPRLKLWHKPFSPPRKLYLHLIYHLLSWRNVNGAIMQQKIQTEANVTHTKGPSISIKALGWGHCRANAMTSLLHVRRFLKEKGPNMTRWKTQTQKNFFHWALSLPSSPFPVSVKTLGIHLKQSLLLCFLIEWKCGFGGWIWYRGLEQRLLSILSAKSALKNSSNVP